MEESTLLRTPKMRVVGLVSIVVTSIILACGCETTKYGDACQSGGASGLIGNDNSSCMTCTGTAEASLNGGGDCSSATLGVFCCPVAGSGSSGGSGSSSSGGSSSGCTSRVCCGGLFECNGACYSTCVVGSQPCCTEASCTCFTPCC
jgi:hypothetical protein